MITFAYTTILREMHLKSRLGYRIAYIISCLLQLEHSSYSVYTLCFLCLLLEEVENKRNYVILSDDDKIQEIPRFRTVLHIIFYYAGMSSISNFASGTHITSLQNYVFYGLGRTQNGKDGQNGCISTYNLV